MDYNFIAGNPVNKTAARVMARGESWGPMYTPGTCNRWEFPKKVKLCPNQKDHELVGVMVGRLTVIGYLGKISAAKNADAKWLVKCNCGWYEARTAKAIRNPNNKHDRCSECKHLLYIRKREYFNRTGKSGDHLELE